MVLFDYDSNYYSECCRGKIKEVPLSTKILLILVS